MLEYKFISWLTRVICRTLQHVECPGGGDCLVVCCSGDTCCVPHTNLVLCTHDLWEVFLLKTRNLFSTTASKSIERLCVTFSYYNSALTKWLSVVSPITVKILCMDFGVDFYCAVFNFWFTKPVSYIFRCMKSKCIIHSKTAGFLCVCLDLVIDFYSNVRYNFITFCIS